MTEHPKTVEGFEGTLEDLAKAISCMSYDSIATLLGALEEEFHVQAKQDREAGKPRLSCALYGAMIALKKAKYAIEEAWQISKPHM